MRPYPALAFTPLIALLPLLPASAPPPALDEPETLTAEQRDFVDTVDVDGRFVPASAAEIELWPDAYAGGLLFLEVTPHGTFVNEGDVIARFELEGIDDQIESAERDLVRTEISHENAVERAKIDTEAEDFRLEDAVLAFERAKKDLEGWEKYELPFHHRSNELTRQQYQNGIADAEHELSQLEAMYRDDELVEATEEIVIQRSRRDLATSKARRKLAFERMDYNDEYDTPETGRRYARAVKGQKGSLDRLVRSLEMGKRLRANDLERSEHGLAEARERLEELKIDRELLTVRAPRAGVVLHGGLRDYLPGQQRPDHRRGSHGSTRTALFCVTDPDALSVALAVSESQLVKVRQGMSVNVTPLVADDRTVVGTLELARYPTAGSAHGAEASFDAQVVLEPRLPGVVVGMRAKLELVVEKIDDALLLPANTIFHDDDGDYCWIAAPDGGEPMRVALTLGAEKDGWVVVTDGLDKIVTVLTAEPE